MQLIVPFRLGWITLFAVSFLLISDNNVHNPTFRADDPAGCDETLEHPDYTFLKRFFEVTNGEQWVNTLANNKPWLKCDICSWYGVVCENGNVIEINLPNNNVSGVFDVRAVEFVKLKKLDLSGNDFSFFASSELDYISALEYLDLSSNHLSSNYNNIYVKATNLKHLDLSDNGLTYVLPEIIDLPALEYFDFSQNEMTGSVPNSIGNMVLLKHLNLSSNDFTGSFPGFVSSYNRLQFLDLSDNRISGCIPTSYNVHCDIQNNVFLDENCTFDDPTFIEFCAGEVCDEQLNLSAPSSTCIGQTFTITAESGYASYEWSVGCDGPQNRAQGYSVVKSCPGTYSVTVTNDKGCTRTGSITIQEYIEPNQNTSASFCEGESVEVAGRTFDSAGVFQVAQTTPQGCSYTLNVSVTEVLRPRNTYNLEICNGSSQSIHGESYNSAGTFTQNVINQNGCDSLLTINVNILNTYSNEVYYSVCPGGTVPHDGEDYGKGTFYRTYDAQNGCDSILTIYVDELETFSSSITLEACEGETVEHDGIDYSESDTRTYQAQNGCDSILHITVNQLPSSSTFETHSICNGQSVEIFDSTYTAGVHNIPYFNENGCLSNLELTVNETAPYIVRDTVQMCNGVQVNYDAMHYYNTPGSFTIDTVDNNGCNYIIELEVPGGTTSIEDITVQRCDNQPVYVNGKSVYDGSVQILTNASGCDSILNIHVNSGFTSDSTLILDFCSNDPPTINGTLYNKTGWYPQTLVNASGCDSLLLIKLTKLNTSTKYLDVQICPNQELTINGETYDGPGFDLQYLTNAVGCDSFLYLTLIESDTIKTDFRKTLCGNESINIGGVTYDETTYDVQSYTTSSGCDSLVYIYIEKYEHTFETINNHLCTGDTLTYNNEKIFAGGTYIQDLENRNGCDSTLTIIINEFSPSESYNVRETCDGDPWSENGENLYTDGIHFQTIPNAVGCDSIITIDLTVHELTFETMDLQVCKDQPRDVNGIFYDVEGTFTQDLTNAAGCDSTLTIIVEIVEEIRAEYHEELCEGGSTTINGEFFDATRTTEQYFTSSIGCDSVLTVSVIVHPHTFGQVDTTVCTGSTTYVNGQAFTAGGVYSQKIENMAGCDSTITVSIKELSPTSSSANYEICEGDSIKINDVIYEYGGEFSQTFTNAVGCDSTFFISILEHPDTEQSIYRYICPGETTTVNNVDYTVPNVYEQSFMNAQGCDSTLYINVEYSAPKDTTLYDFICDEGEYAFKGSVYYSQGIYQFDTLTQRGCDSTIFLNLGLLTGTDTTIYRTICKNQFYTFGVKNIYQSGSYFDEIIIGGCKTPTTLELTVLDPVEGYREVHKCEGELFWVNGKYESEPGLYTEIIQSSQGCDSILNSRLIYETAKETIIDTFLCHGESVYFDFFLYTEPGNYRIRRKTSYGCDSIVKLNIEWYDNEIDYFNMNVCAGETATFEGNEYSVGTYNGKYFDGFCTQKYELVVEETSLIKLNKTLMLCEGDSVEYLGKWFDYSGQFYLGEEIGTCEFVEYVNVVRNIGEGIIKELFLCKGTSLEVGELLIEEEGDYLIENCGETESYHISFIEGDTIFMEHKINPGQSINIEGKLYDESGTYLIEIGNEAGCSSILYLSIQVEACDGERIIWQTLCEGESYNFYGRAIDESGQYEYVKNLSFSCDSIIKLDIQFSSVANFEIEGEETICSGESMILSGPDGYSYLWNTGDTSRQISVNQSADFELVITDASGCTQNARFTTEVVTFPTSLDIYKTEPSECGVEDGVIEVDVPQPENYLYSKNGGDDWQESPIFNELGAGNYSILLADPSLTCTRKNTFEITLENDGIPEIQDLYVTQSNDCVERKGSILVLMKNSELDMEYSIDGGVNWSEGNYFTDLEDGRYELLISPVGSECVNNFTDIIEIENTAGLESFVTIEKELTCIDSGDAVAKANVVSGSGPYIYTWSNGSSDSIASSLDAGSYSVTVSDKDGCVEQIGFEIEQLDLTAVTAEFQDSFICDSDTLLYTDLDNAYHYQLFKEDEFIAEGNQFEITETGHYQVIASNDDGCHTGSDFLVEEAFASEMGADFLLSSNGLLGEEIFMINISDPMPEIYHWEFDTSMVETEVMDSLTQKLTFKDTGAFSIVYAVDNEGCLLKIEKTIRIFKDSLSIEEEAEILDYGLEFWSVSPNPNDGNFNVEVSLSKPGGIKLLLFDMFGSRIGAIPLNGKSSYHQKVKLPSLQTGIYSLVLLHKDKVYQKNILIIN
ncbi:T9SS type A sorting domain-containing protein [Portibacter lacus]|uniref:PKD domain-containing protein n=1 Tax=Portibacter lacus TaxID=1099794 RepID=A0AA37SPW8_9BACT|nr:T9SS type A sorting domain-containing protein [Portibacter lacus]GLR17064.1 hypothetical protein GCM10007940_16790 [Portibacter lacus]